MMTKTYNTPESIDKLYEYGKLYPEIYYELTPMKFISENCKSLVRELFCDVQNTDYLRQEHKKLINKLNQEIEKL
jgi:hypothetical protein